MDKFFKPQKLAVIGVSERKTNLTLNILKNLETFDFKGEFFPVGPKGGEVFGKKIYKSVLDIEGDIDLALILTPADTVPSILEECGQKGIRNVVIQSAGFREFGEKGKEREKELLEVTQKYGIKFIGPNCIGLIDFHHGMVLPFLVMKNIYPKGGVSIVSQSGGVGWTFLNIFVGERIGIAKFASIGNKLNLDENDLIEYYINDDETEIILAYLESVSDGQRLMKLARKSNKPILIYKSNTGKLSQSIAASHTAAISSNDAVVDAAFHQAGIVRFKNRQTMINYLKILPMPKIKGNNLAILSRSGGHAILAADAAEENGFKLARFRPELLKEIEKNFRASVIKLTNPLDLGDVFDYNMYKKVIELAAAEDDVDAVVFFHTCFSESEHENTKELIEESYKLSKKIDKPILICMEMNASELLEMRQRVQAPIFSSVLETIMSLSLSRDFHCKSEKTPQLPPIDADKKTATEIINRCKKEGRSPTVSEGMDIFNAYGIPVVKSRFVRNENELIKSAENIGYPVAFKVVSEDIVHKTEVGGVQLNLANGKELKSAYSRMIKEIERKMPKAAVKGVLLQPMISDGWEMILGAKRDRNFGPVVLVGMGGIFVEVLRDSSMRVVPFTRYEAYNMLKELKGYKILKGARGKEPYDIENIVDSLMKLSRLIADYEEISEIDVNPYYIFRGNKGGLAIDARIIL